MKNEKVIIVGVQTNESDIEFENSMDELALLTDTAGGVVVARLTQKRKTVASRTFIGKGKLSELVNLVEELEPSTVVFNQELSPSQVRNIQESVDAKIIDRMQLILDIFAMRANSREGRLQVELAQQQYMLPRLVGQGINMSRLGGGIGTRGPGETRLETDRRYIQKRITDIKRELQKVSEHRERSRSNRQSSGVFQIGLVGYTNAGKSTLLNALTEAETLEEDALFATLDPLTRKFELPEGLEITLTDTVGFIQDLPTELVEAFQSTLEETRNMDLILHVIDASADNIEIQEDTVIELLKDINIDTIPRMTIYNKKDLVTGAFLPRIYPHFYMSARDEVDVELLKEQLLKKIKEVMVPYKRVIEARDADELAKLRSETIVENRGFDNATNQYIVSGYAKEGSKWLYQPSKD